MTITNIMDINIYDIHGNEYDINNLYVNGNDEITIFIKRTDEEYIVSD